MWTPPDSFPDLSSAKQIAIDIETRDDNLLKLGPGVRRDGYIVGVAVGTDDGFRGYYPIAHEEGGNLDRDAVLRWLTAELSTDIPKVGANLLYDLDYLTHAGVKVGGKILDVQIAEPLLDENKQGRYALEHLAQHWLGESKKSDVLEAACKERGLKGNPAKHIWKLPASVVGPYAETDVDLPLRILPLQLRQLQAESLMRVFDIETRLTPLLLQMRQTGVRLDHSRVEANITEYEEMLKGIKRKLKQVAGDTVPLWESEAISKVFDKLGLEYPLTPKKKQPSFTQSFLNNHPHEVAQLIVEGRRVEKFVNTFLRGQMLDQMDTDGRIHTEFNQLKSDEYGTVTGRFSSSHPNLQFMPMRDPVLGPLCRSMFIPEEDHDWGKSDYKQIEYRIFAHYAIGNEAELLRREFQDDPEMDVHQWCADMAKISRDHAKTINFGIIYGMGVATTAAKLGLSEDEGRDFLNKYHEAVPFAKQTLRIASDRARRRGYVRTVLGRRRRFERYEPADWNLSRETGTFATKEEASAAVWAAIKSARKRGKTAPRSGVRRAATHKALNAVVQGSAAEVIKTAMVNAYEAGLFNTLVPHITLHDELDVSVPRTKEGREAWDCLLNTMQTAIKFKVPLLVDASLKANWGAE